MSWREMSPMEAAHTQHSALSTRYNVRFMLPASLQTPAAIVLLVGGVISCFAGYRVFRVVLGVYGFIIGALLASSFMGAEQKVWMVVAAIGGVGMSGSLAMTSALTGDLFGRYSVGSLFGLIFLSHQAGAALGSWLGGALFDLTGGYGAAFAVAAALLLIAAGLSLAINETARTASRAVPLPGRPHPVAGGR